NFIQIDRVLRSHGFSAPEIYRENPKEKLMLIEDFGDTSFTKAMALHPEQEWPLYELAVRLLVHLHECSIDGLSLHRYTKEMLNAELQIFIDWCLVNKMEPSRAGTAGAALLAIFEGLY